MLNSVAAAWSSSVSPKYHCMKWRKAEPLARRYSSVPSPFSQFRSPYFSAPRPINSAQRVRSCSLYGVSSGVSRSNRGFPSCESRTMPEAYSDLTPESLVSNVICPPRTVMLWHCVPPLPERHASTDGTRPSFDALSIRAVRWALAIEVACALAVSV